MPVNTLGTKQSTKDSKQSKDQSNTPPIDQALIDQANNAQLAEAEFLRARIIDLSLTEKHQQVEIETLEAKLSAVTQTISQSINQSNNQSNAAPLIALQKSLSAMDVKTAELQQEVLDLHQSFNHERMEAEKVFDAALVDQSVNFNQSLFASQKVHLSLVEQRAKIESFADMQSNMQARLNEFHRRVDEQRRLHAEKCATIWQRWIEAKTSLQTEHDRRTQETEAQYKATAMKMMNISYGPMNEEIQEYRDQRVDQLRIIDELNVANEQLKHELRDLAKLKKAKQSELDASMENLFEIKLAIKQAKQEVNEYINDRVSLERQAAEKQAVDTEQRRQELERLDRELNQYDQASLIAQVNVNRLRTCIERAEFQRANHPFERVLIESINQVKGGRRITVDEFLAAERMSVLAAVLSKMTHAERIRQERGSETFFQDESKVEESSDVSVCSTPSVLNDVVVPLSVVSDWATIDSLTMPVESTDIEGSFFLTQMDADSVDDQS